MNIKELFKEVDFFNFGGFWETKNSALETVASGLYIYSFFVDDGQNRQITTGKIAIIR